MGVPTKDVFHPFGTRKGTGELASLLRRVHERAEVVMENDTRHLAVIRRVETSGVRLILKSDSPAFGSPRYHLIP
jgi:hypothetical protein